ncbi:asparaginase [Amycolatopsis cynarae]|uniref:asparaginase n=1 Tax=Amycolatopsis cynarae TaxID=2995223 RepID=A0ABY7B5C0_9PSEU|nr:asparaginase [Amycolatopsis sp. HUAS 11-8]WAL65993.1 asparaginase [Amycolatopsis sp. HUAS 11-8]
MIVVLSTGGTIASRPDGDAAPVATLRGAALLGTLPRPPQVPVVVRDLLCRNSFLLNLVDMHGIVRAVRDSLSDPAVRGVVVTHGTDTMEETAFLAELCHRDARPVVFTGAQRTMDEPAPDGPANLANAISVAADGRARGRGALIVFHGTVHPAAGTRKVDTVALDAFFSPDRFGMDAVTWPDPVGRWTGVVDLDRADLGSVRVDIVPYYPGSDLTALRAVVAAGASGVVLDAVGAGNASAEVCAEVARLTAAGVVVALTSRVPRGPITARYGGGGGADLVAAGAIPTGLLRAAQVRVLLAALLAVGRGPKWVAAHLRDLTAGTAATTRRGPMV